MIEKALILIIFMYFASYGALAGQWFADSYGVTIVNFEGVPIESNVLGFLNQDDVDNITGNFTSINQTTAESNPITAAAEAAWDMFLLLTGTYIFNFLILMGAPTIIVIPMVTVYGFLVVRAFIGYFRGA